MAYEIDFLPVGEGEKSGDAIALRLGNLHGQRTQQFVAVVDGGFTDTGKQLVEHIRKYYQTDEVDLVVSTHPDDDHSSGLRVVLEKLRVGKLWLHRPWRHSSYIRGLFTDGRVTASGISDRLKRSLETACELEKIAERRGIPIEEPFSDTHGTTSPIHVLGPSLAYYSELLPNFRGLTPEGKAIEPPSFLQELLRAAGEKIKSVLENWGVETLTDPAEDATSAENNSSVILLLPADDKLLLLTGDAGVPALSRATDFAETVLRVDLKGTRYCQVPHHGSKRNVGPTLLDRILGPRRGQEAYDKTAFVSAAKDGNPKHPAKKVVNAYKRRGAQVYATQGSTKWQHSNDAPARSGFSDATPLPFYTEVEEDD